MEGSTCRAALYLLLLFATASLLVTYSSGGYVSWNQSIPYVLVIGLVFVAAAMIPLVVSRHLGIRLVNNRDFRERRNEVSNETGSAHLSS